MAYFGICAGNFQGLLCLKTRGAFPLDLEDKLYPAIKYTAEVYAVSWLEIKRDDTCHNQQLYIFSLTQRIKQQSEETQTLAYSNFDYNALA